MHLDDYLVGEGDEGVAHEGYLVLQPLNDALLYEQSLQKDPPSIPSYLRGSLLSAIEEVPF